MDRHVERAGLLCEEQGLATRDHQKHIGKHNTNQQGQLGLTHGYKGAQANPKFTLHNLGSLDAEVLSWTSKPSPLDPPCDIYHDKWLRFTGVFCSFVLGAILIQPKVCIASRFQMSTVWVGDDLKAKRCNT